MAQVTRHRAAGALLGVLALVACTNSSKSNATSSTDSAGQPVETTIVIGPNGSSSAVVVPNDTSPGGGATSPTNGGGDAPSTVDSTGPPGSFAPGILQASTSSQLLVEIRAQASADPQQASIDHLTSVLESVTGKSVSVARGAAIGGGAKSWSADELRADGAAGAAQTRDRSVIHLLFVLGDFGGDSSVLGVSVRGDTAAVFIDQVHASSTPLVGSGGIEAAVVTHEVGHLMGLVDLFLHTGRQDPQHPGHSTNTKSVMYWAVESNVVADLLQGGPPKDFDSADLADLQTIHNSG
jgi:hypothetical protein